MSNVFIKLGVFEKIELKCGFIHVKEEETH